MRRALLIISVTFLLSASIAFAAPVSNVFNNVIPSANDKYDLGTTTPAAEWLHGFFNTLCIQGDCRTAWPAGGGGTGSGLATTSPIAAGNLLEYSSAGAGSAFGIGTSTLTPSAPLTGSFTQIGSGGSLGLDTSGTWSGNAGTVTNGVYTTTFNGLFDTRFITSLAATTSVKSIITLSSLSLPYSQLTGTPVIASTTLLGDSNTFSGTLDTFSNTIKVAALSGLIGGNSGTLYSVATSSLNASITGSAANVGHALTFNNGGSGASSGQTFDGTAAATISYNTIGAQVAGTYDAVVTATTPIIRTANNFTFVGLATTSQPSSSNLLTSNGTAGVYGTATSSLGVTGPITFSGTIGAQVGGVGGNFGCTTASSGVGGCLGSTAFDTFNNKIGWGQATSTSANQVVYTDALGKLTSTASSTETCTAPLSCTGHAVLSGGGAITITQSGTGANGYLSSTDFNTFNNKIGWGQATSTSANQFVYTNNLGLLVSVASSSLNLPNSALQNSSLTVNTTAPLTGGGAIALGGSITVACASCDTFGNPFSTASNFGATRVATTSPIGATNGAVWFQSGLFASTTAIFDNATSTNATTTNFKVSGQTNLGLGNALLLSGTTGIVTAYGGASSCGAGQAFTGLSALGASTCNVFDQFSNPFSTATNFGQTVVATTSPIAGTNLPLWFQSGLYASTTAIFDNATSTNATTTTFAITGQSASSGNNCLQIDTNGRVTKTGSVCGAGGGLSAYDAFTHPIFGYSATTTSFMFGTSTPQNLAQLTVGTSSQQLALLDNTNNPAFNFRAIAGNFFLATSSPATFATSTNAIISILQGTGNLIAGLFGIASSTPTTALSIGTGTASSSLVVAEYAYGKGSNIATSTAQVFGPNLPSNSIDWGLGNAATTLTLCLEPGEHVTIRVSNPAAVAGALTWAVCTGEQLYWPAGTTPTQTTTANNWDVWSFVAYSNIGSSTPGNVVVSGAQTAAFH